MKGGSVWLGAKTWSAGTFWKDLHDQDDKIEVEGEHRADDIQPSPDTGEVPGIAGITGHGEHDEGDGAECEAGSHALESGSRIRSRSSRPSLSGRTRSSRRAACSRSARQDDKSRDDRGQADRDVNNRKGWKVGSWNEHRIDSARGFAAAENGRGLSNDASYQFHNGTSVVRRTPATARRFADPARDDSSAVIVFMYAPPSILPRSPDPPRTASLP